MGSWEMCEDVLGPINVIIVMWITIGSIFYVRLYLNFLSSLSNLILITTEWRLVFSMENKILIIATEKIVTYAPLKKQSYSQNLCPRWHWAKSYNLWAAMQTLTTIYCPFFFLPQITLNWANLGVRDNGNGFGWISFSCFMLRIQLLVQLLNENRWWYWNLVLYHCKCGGYGWVSLFLL